MTCNNEVEIYTTYLLRFTGISSHQWKLTTTSWRSEYTYFLMYVDVCIILCLFSLPFMSKWTTCWSWRFAIHCSNVCIIVLMSTTVQFFCLKSSKQPPATHVQCNTAIPQTLKRRCLTFWSINHLPWNSRINVFKSFLFIFYPYFNMNGNFVFDQ